MRLVWSVIWPSESIVPAAELGVTGEKSAVMSTVVGNGEVMSCRSSTWGVVNVPPERAPVAVSLVPETEVGLVRA